MKLPLVEVKDPSVILRPSAITHPGYCTHTCERERCQVCSPGAELQLRVVKQMRQLVKGTLMGIVRYLGCDSATLRGYLEARFGIGMTWANYGSWHIDHIIPIRYVGAGGGSPTLEEVIARLHYTNTQPFWGADNIAKGNRWIGGKRNEPADNLLQLSSLTIDGAEPEGVSEEPDG